MTSREDGATQSDCGPDTDTGPADAASDATETGAVNAEPDEAEPDEDVDDSENQSIDPAQWGKDRAGANRWWAGSAVRWTAALVLAAVLAVAGYEGWVLFQQRQDRIASAQALEAAQKYALALTNIDPNSIDENFADVLDGATGEFKDMYTASSAQLRQALIDNKAAAQGTVIEAAVKSAAENKVEVVLFVDQSVRNAVAPEPQLDRSRVTMTMEKVDGRWLAAKVDLS